MILLENVKKIYQSKNGDVIAVDRANLKIEEGEIFGVIGYSGAGKSSLIRLFNQLEKPTSGQITVANRLISAITGNELRKARQEIGMIFQHFNLLWSRTVRENIAFPLEIAGVDKKERKKRVDELIRLVGLEGRGDAYPSQLSGGQKQRVGIARALANNPKVLLCDEATSALDPETTDQILDLLLDINKRLNLTIVLITHEMHVIQKICNRVAVMEKGKIVETGSVLEVFRNPQQEITKRFVQQLTDSEDTNETIENLLEKYPDGKVIRLQFIGDSVERPVLQGLMRREDVEVSVLQGNIAQTNNGAYGSLIVHLNGEEAAIQQAIAGIHQEKVELEVVAHG
ncbi:MULTISPECIES: methionine ABC transporter ATP-binding protein [Bacillus cereus group]|uniref:Methionine import ATP-binding protein MetN n=1 Tax=Bacillus cytotoxicus TaxID=580165 RepID=A0AAX2CMA1_9BACI|nr:MULTISPECIES: methionine ABC transporter ATP-binding protein [Bacillus cereus group]AWC30379.1 methionine ABC transporter ATP-binding protein [Bacillus cytotoxicus]AWC34422.1 methionine ABC transporter ATP-binding protein [Bacillus cytotoxicus]AWC38420.1 methionine ABC transporter ATP-binding protein [Bacillus cytotoxicus]AWC42519.1 methionine ABC transporter ATP-binding protein [Bacillus cytotoxicus]AWC50450.1 methionine ABC transporter ATP-binding protein [Bacillus cytotoxicus]